MKRLLDIAAHVLLPLETILMVLAVIYAGREMEPTALKWLSIVTFAILALVHAYVTYALYTRKAEK